MEPNTVTLDDLRDSANDVNQLGTVGSEGYVYRDRPMATVAVRVSDVPDMEVQAGPVIYTQKEQYSAWIRQGSQSGNSSHTDHDYIIPAPIVTAPQVTTAA